MTEVGFGFESGEENTIEKRWMVERKWSAIMLIIIKS